ncbi:hypothetical protein GCM10027182_18790 [Aquaspirillum soli]
MPWMVVKPVYNVQLSNLTSGNGACSVLPDWAVKTALFCYDTSQTDLAEQNLSMLWPSFFLA